MKMKPRNGKGKLGGRKRNGRIIIFLFTRAKSGIPASNFYC